MSAVAPRASRKIDLASPLVCAGAVALVAVTVYLNSLSNGFAYDDEFIVKDHGVVHTLDAAEIVRSPYWPREEFTAAGLYRPLTLLTYALDWQIWDGDPFGFHLVNILLHAAVSALVVLLLFRFFPWWASLAGGLVFAVHSVHTEAVANVVGRAELLVALFTLIACLMYIRATRGEGITLSSGLAISALYALAAFSKEAGVVLPGLLLVTDLPLLRRLDAARLRSFLRKRLPLFVALTCVLVLVFVARWLVLGAAIQHKTDRAFALDDSFGTRFFTMIRVWPRYVELLLFPLDLSADYSPAIILPTSGLTPFGVIGIALVVGTLILTVALYRRIPELSMAVAWTGIGLLPVSNLIIMAEIVLAERTLYLPSIAVSMVVALLMARARRTPRRWLVAALAAWIVAFSVVTVRRNPVWDSTYTVFEDLRRRHPESSRLLWGVAWMLMQQGDTLRAEEWFDRSLEVWPHHAPYRAEYATYLLERGKLEKAEDLAIGAVRLDPDDAEYRALLALIRYKAKDYEGALRVLEGGLAEVGPHPKLYATLADVHLALGRPERAVAAQRRAIALSGEEPSWRTLLRLVVFQYAAGDHAAACATLARAQTDLGADSVVLQGMRRACKGPRAQTPADTSASSGADGLK